ncbi:MAG: hypothetical protein KIT48_01435 [Pseudolabrys sp.]|nr:hypothetical protein [Pseudolabrys sp.]
MGLFKVSGTIAAIGQGEFNNHGTFYAFMEIREPGGRRVIVHNVGVLNHVASSIVLGGDSEFFFDKFFVFGRSFVSQLWGVKTTDGLVTFDNDMRKQAMAVSFLIGTLTIPLLGIGFLLIALGLLQLLFVMLKAGARKRMFYGTDRAEARRLHQQLPVRI